MVQSQANCWGNADPEPGCSTWAVGDQQTPAVINLESAAFDFLLNPPDGEMEKLKKEIEDLRCQLKSEPAEANPNPVPDPVPEVIPAYLSNQKEDDVMITDIQEGKRKLDFLAPQLPKKIKQEKVEQVAIPIYPQITPEYPTFQEQLAEFATVPEQSSTPATEQMAASEQCINAAEVVQSEEDPKSVSLCLNNVS
mgnify:CR=1 FL=1